MSGLGLSHALFSALALVNSSACLFIWEVPMGSLFAGPLLGISSPSSKCYLTSSCVGHGAGVVWVEIPANIEADG